MRRHEVWPLALIVSIGLAIPGVAANGPQDVPATEAGIHLLKRVEPIYPIPAKVAHGGGKVRLAIVISPTGSVASAKLVSGYPMLATAAINAVKQWKYRPFEQGGKAIAVNTLVDVVFPDGWATDAQIQAEHDFYVQADVCRAATSLPNAEKNCSQAVELSNQLPKDRISERSSVRILLANALMAQHQPPAAIPLYEQALELDKIHLSSSDPAIAADYRRLGGAYAAAHDLAKADAAYRASAEALQAAIPEWPAMKEEYTRQLKGTLEDYARVKLAESQPNAAQQLRLQAEALQP
jgi:TonB family protein